MFSKLPTVKKLSNSKTKKNQNGCKNIVIASQTDQQTASQPAASHHNYVETHQTFHTLCLFIYVA